MGYDLGTMKDTPAQKAQKHADTLAARARRLSHISKGYAPALDAAYCAQRRADYLKGLESKPATPSPV
jgi:hypothetical protein